MLVDCHDAYVMEQHIKHIKYHHHITSPPENYEDKSDDFHSETLDILAKCYEPAWHIAFASLKALQIDIPLFLRYLTIWTQNW